MGMLCCVGSLTLSLKKRQSFAKWVPNLLQRFASTFGLVHQCRPMTICSNLQPKIGAEEPRAAVKTSIF